jgi:lysophospholipase L1-like esterase
MGIMDFRKVPDAALPTRLAEASLNATYGPDAAGMKAAFGQLAAADRPANITLDRAFDPATRAYNINRSTLAKARAGLARGMSGGAPMRLHFLGHSFITSSQGSTGHDVIPTLARRIMAADGAFGTVAEGQVMMNYTPAASTWGGVGKDPRFTFGSGWAYQGSWGLGYGGESAYSANFGSGDLTWTPDYPVDSFTIYYYQQAGSAQFSYAVDGGSFSSTGITFGTGSTFVLKSQVVSAGAAGTHTLTIRPHATVGRTYIGAVYGTNSTIKPAVEVVNGGASGSVAVGQTVGSWTYLGYQGVGGPLDAIGYYKPDLALLMLGVNDAAAQTEAAFSTAMTTIIQKVQTSGGDVILLREPATTSSFTKYGQTLYDLCDTLGVGLIETGIDWPSVIATSQAEPYVYIGADAGHPGPRGNYDIAKTVVNALRSAI